MKRRSSAAAAAVAAIVLAGPASAGADTVTIRGRVENCGSHRPLAGATIELRNFDEGWISFVSSDGGGRFSHVGLRPGRYLVAARSGDRYFVSRAGYLAGGDDADVHLGETEFRQRSNTHGSNSAGWTDPSDTAPHVFCDPPSFRAQPRTEDVYTLR